MVREVPADSAGMRLVDESPDRYALFLFSTQLIRIRPVNSQWTQGIPLTDTPHMPFWISHALHGTFASLGWEVHSGMLGAFVGVIESFMLETIKEAKVQRAGPSTIIASESHRSDNSRIRPGTGTVE